MIDPALHSAVLAWYLEQGRDLPWRHTRDPYRILVSEMMLQQTQVDRVLPKYQAFLEQYPTFAVLAEAPVAEVIRSWQGLGYNLRAVRLQRIAKQVIERGGALPETAAELQTLDGIGPYTASAVACFAFGRAEPVLDTNVRRVLGRIMLGPEAPKTASPAVLWDLARKALPTDDAYDWNQALMDLGARICVESTPRCLVCPAQPFCVSAGRVAPALRERRASYNSAKSGSFHGSRRYYRGRVVEYLRTVAPGETVALPDLGAAIKPDYSAADAQWLAELATDLQRDGLLHIDEHGRVSLP